MTSQRQKLVDAILTELEQPRYVVNDTGAYIIVSPSMRATDMPGPDPVATDFKFHKWPNTGPDVLRTAIFARNSLNAEEIVKAIERLRGGRVL